MQSEFYKTKAEVLVMCSQKANERVGHKCLFFESTLQNVPYTWRKKIVFDFNVVDSKNISYIVLHFICFWREKLIFIFLKRG